MWSSHSTYFYLASTRTSRRPSPIDSGSHHEELTGVLSQKYLDSKKYYNFWCVEAQKVQADPYRAKAKERLGIPLDEVREYRFIY